MAPCHGRRAREAPPPPPSIGERGALPAFGLDKHGQGSPLAQVRTSATGNRFAILEDRDEDGRVVVPAGAHGHHEEEENDVAGQGADDMELDHAAQDGPGAGVSKTSRRRAQRHRRALRIKEGLLRMKEEVEPQELLRMKEEVEPVDARRVSTGFRYRTAMYIALHIFAIAFVSAFLHLYGYREAMDHKTWSEVDTSKKLARNWTMLG